MLIQTFGSTSTGFGEDGGYYTIVKYMEDTEEESGEVYVVLNSGENDEFCDGNGLDEPWIFATKDAANAHAKQKVQSKYQHEQSEQSIEDMPGADNVKLTEKMSDGLYDGTVSFDPDVETYVGQNFRWRTVTCTLCGVPAKGPAAPSKAATTSKPATKPPAKKTIAKK